MSGIEVVGLVLGAVPLVISALEHYKEGIDVISDFRNYRSTLKSLKTKLSIQEELYRGTLQRLLVSELSPSEVHALFPEPGVEGCNALWGTQEIEDKLRRKLGAKFGLFMDVVADMNAIMEKLMEKLDIDINGKPKWKPSYSADARFQDRFAWEWRRIRRSLGKAEREELISSFERYNNNLASFVQNSEILAPKSDGRGKGFVKYLDLVRSQACGLHAILGNNWKCACNNPHEAYLRLQHPPEASPSPPKFGVSFPPHQTATVGLENIEQERILWNHIFVSISKIEKRPEPPTIETNSLVPFSVPAAQAPQRPLKFGSSLKVTPREKKYSKVQFSRTTKGSMNNLTVLPVDLSAVSPLQDTIHLTTTSLCSTIYARPPPEKIVGRVLDATEDQVALIIDATQESSKPFCLNMLLSKSVTSPQIPQKLSDKDRLKIALTLASTALQLYDSPWIDSAWSGRDIQFLTSKNTNSYEAPLDGPFVSALFQGSISAPESQKLAPTSSSFVDSLIPSKVLFALAVMLVELCLDKTLVEMRQPGSSEQTSNRNATLLDDYETAHEQLNAVYQKSGSNYGDVVQRCLKCEFNITPQQKRLDFEKFRHLVYEGVVAPLEENYRKYLLYRGDI